MVQAVRGGAIARLGFAAKALPRAWRSRERLWVGAASVAAFLLLWQVNAWIQVVDPRLVASPSAVVGALGHVARDGLFTVHGPASLLAVTLGFFPAMIIGVVGGVVIGYVRRLTYLLEPVIMAFDITPRIALIPLLIMWLGIGLQSKAAVVFLSAVFPILINSLAGVRGVEPLWLRCGAAFGATPLQKLRNIVIPGAMPAILTGLRLGFGRTLIGVIVAEFYVSTAGVGYALRLYQHSLRTEAMLAVVVTVSVFGFLGIQALRAIERRVSPWEDIKW